MTINSIQQVFREIPVASAVPQLSLTRRDRELQMEEGQPPMEVASAELGASCWQKNEDLREKWKKRKCERSVKRESQDNAAAYDPLDGMGAEAEASMKQPQSLQERLQKSIEVPEEEETGTLFDDRS